MKMTARLLCTAAVLALLLGGCATSSGPEPVVGPQFHSRITPEDIVYNVQLAYREMDAAEYLDCLSQDFEFYPTEEDVQDPGMQLPPVWYKTDEQEMHENMFDDGSNVESITLTLTITSLVIEEGIPADPLDDSAVCQVAVDLRVNLLQGLTYLVTSPAEFHMRIDTDQVGAGGEYLWEIYGWLDLGDSGRGTGNAPREDATWGGVKAMYR